MKNDINTFIASLSNQGRSRNTVESYRSDLIACWSFFQSVGIDEWDKVDRYTIMDLITHLQKQGRANATINRYLSSLRQLYRFLIQEARVTVNPLALIRQLPVEIDQQGPQTVLSLVELNQLMQAPDLSQPLGVRDRALLELFYATGMRVSEVLRLKVDQIHIDLRVINLQSANGHSRIVPLAASCCDWLQRYLASSRPALVTHDDGFVFVNAHGRQLTRQGVWKIFRQQTKAAQLNREVTPQILRHTFVADLLTNGANWQGVQALLGQTPANTTYARLLTLSSQELMDLYDRYHTDLN